jgi:hypothetical protein
MSMSRLEAGVDSEQLNRLLQPVFTDFDDGLRLTLEQSPTLLAHYTSMEVLEKICRYEELWFSSPLFMNDPEELRFGMAKGRQLFEQSVEIKTLCGSEARRKIMMQAFALYSDTFDKQYVHDIYAFCLSPHDPSDNDGRLSMWREYGGQGSGAALVFKTDFLSTKADSPMMILKVGYGSNDERVAWFEGKIRQVCQIMSPLGLDEGNVHFIALAIFSLIQLFTLKFKHHGFREEQEWRLVYFPNRDTRGILRDRLGYTNGPRGLEQKLRMKIEPLPLKDRADWTFNTILDRIILGPRVSSSTTVAVKRMLDIVGKPEFSDRVVLSGIPHRR